jgi:hypothetical protein
MGGQPIADLRMPPKPSERAVHRYEGTDRVKVAVVPFAASVNVGPQDRDLMARLA